MKFQLHSDDDFYEDYNQPRKNKKVKNNIIVEMTAEEQEECAKKLVDTALDYRNIFGYVARDNKTNNNCFIKYDKANEIKVIYDNNKKILFHGHCPYREYTGNMYDANQRYEYIDEIPRGM